MREKNLHVNEHSKASRNAVSRSALWKNRLWSFHKGDTKLEGFLPKNQHIQRKLLNFEFWINCEVSKSVKFDFQSHFSWQTSSKSFSFFSLKNTNLGSYFFGFDIVC